jgi:uncharacterized membrane protein
MESTGLLALAAAAFLVTHCVPSTPLRPALVRALGENAYLGTYTLVSFATLAWMIWAYIKAPFVPVWDGSEFKPWAVFIMPVSLVLLACGITTRNPSAVRQEATLRSSSEATGILRVTRHPLMWGIALWALVHVIARGDAASIVFFGTFLVLALAGTALIDSRKNRTLGMDWKRFVDVTSSLPFGAILRGRNRFRFAEIGWGRIALGFALYFVVLSLHPWLFGAKPY